MILDYAYINSVADEYRRAAQLPLLIDLDGWHQHEPIFMRLMKEMRPTTYIEVGCHKGASIARVASFAEVMGLPTICIGVDFWSSNTIHDQFLYNMVKTGLAARVFPLKSHSLDAAARMQREGIKAQLIYIDAHHTKEACRGDMEAYYPLLDEGGVMFGDDFTEEPGVSEAVAEFCGQRSLNFHHSYYHWCLEPKR